MTKFTYRRGILENEHPKETFFFDSDQNFFQNKEVKNKIKNNNLLVAVSELFGELCTFLLDYLSLPPDGNWFAMVRASLARIHAAIKQQR